MALAISSVLRNNLDLIEEMTNITEMNQNTLMLVNTTQQGLTYLVQLSNIPEDELFKISMNFWHFFANDVLSKTKPISLVMNRTQEIPFDNNLDFSNFSTQFTQANKLTLMHHQVYPAILRDIKVVMIDFMVKPQEVLVTIDESGDLEQEVVEDSEMRELFETMRETLIFLTNQNPGEAEQIF